MGAKPSPYREAGRITCACLVLCFGATAAGWPQAPRFEDGFDSGDLCAWLTSVDAAITEVRPLQGSIGTVMEIEGTAFANPAVNPGQGVSLRQGTTEVPLEVLEFSSTRITARLGDVTPVGLYDVVAGGCVSSPVAAGVFSVEPPVLTDAPSVFVRAGDQVTITGRFFGVEPGQIFVRSQRDLAAFAGAQVLFWHDPNAPVSVGPAETVFAVPSGLTENGYYDVALVNGFGSATTLARLVAVGVDDGDTEDLRVVSAVAISNTEILVQFSEPVQQEGAEDPANYKIDGPPLVRTPVVGVLAAELLFPNLDVVKLTTISQSDIFYTLTVLNVRDLAGNPIAPPDILIDPSKTTFVGIPPGGGVVVDSDGDGLSDADEQAGWIVTVTHPDGSTEVRHVTSDPGNPFLPVDDPVNAAARDTDGEGVTDNEEKHGAMDPRSPDTDGDTLTDNEEWNIIYSDPTHQDTDGDGTQDGFEFYSYRTSPVLADTDGDQINDTDEVLARFRDPRVADLPEHGISIGDVRLQIDERFTFEDVQGETVTNESSSTVTLTRGESTTRSIVGSAFAQAVLGLKGGVSGQRESNFPFVEAGVEFTGGGAIQISKESTTESQRVREESLAKARELSTTSTVTREIFGARIDVDVSLANLGDLAFSISNLEITVLDRSRESTRRFVPVATLVPNSELVTGEPATFNLGPFTSEHGPILFTSQDVFPNLVDELMQSPSGLVFEVANFDLTDEYGRLFTFSNQIARDRTGGIIVDSGDGVVARHYVAAALQPDPDGFGGPAGEFVGGFNGDGSPKGIPLDFALQDTLELTKNSTVLDGIVAGPDQVADSIAAGDDIQLIPPDTTGVGVGSIVVAAGANGVLDSVVAAGDQAEVTTGYETSLTCDAESDKPRELCSIDDDCKDPALTDTGSCTGPEVLVRFGSLRTGDFDRQWVVFTTDEVPAGADFGRLTLRPGEDFFFAFVQDLDLDGVFAREEFLSGSTDSKADLLDNSTFGRIVDPLAGESFELVPPVACGNVPPAPCDGIPDSKDTDRDGLGDFAEIRVGWRVSADDGLLRQVFSSPRLADSDGEGVLDLQEQDLRAFCGSTCGVDSPVNAGGACSENAECSLSLGECVDFGGLVCSGDLETSCTTSADCNIPGSCDVSDPRQDALCSFQGDPEVARLDAIAIIAGPDGMADSVAAPGDVQLVAPGTSGLTYGTPVVGPGGDTVVDTLLEGDDLYLSVESSQRIPPATDPSLSDTDLDGVEEFDELTGYNVGLSIRDGDTVAPPELDIAESQAIGDDVQQAFLGGPVFPGGIVVLPGENGVIDSTPGGDDVLSLGVTVVTDPLRRDTDGDLVDDGTERAKGGDPTDSEDGDEFRDSDQDGLTDAEETILGWRVSVNGGASYAVLSNPSRPDSDFDGLPDFAERVLRTDPNKADTDGDGLRDFDEMKASDFEQFFGLDEQFPGFFVDGASSQQYGTDPTRVHSDNDGLTDHEELVEGYQVLLAGEETFRQVFTNPLVEDTDLDGVDDDEEKFGTNVGDPIREPCVNTAAFPDFDFRCTPSDDSCCDNCPVTFPDFPVLTPHLCPLIDPPQYPYQYPTTDATDPDTDDDGRSDGIELTAQTNPLVPDVGITVTYKRLLLLNVPVDGDGAEVSWFFLVKKPGDGGNGELLSNAWDCNEDLTECGAELGTDTDCPYFGALPNETYVLPIGLDRVNPGGNNFESFPGQASFPLKEGESFSVIGALMELDDNTSSDCNQPPFYIPASSDGRCVTTWDLTFSFEDFADGGQASFPQIDGSDTQGNCNWEVDLEIVAN